MHSAVWTCIAMLAAMLAGMLFEATVQIYMMP